MLKWYAVQTDPQCEFRALRGLKDLRYTTFLPVETRWKRARNKQRERRDTPLFTGYLFVGVTPEQQLWPIPLVDGVRAFVTLNGRAVEIGEIEVDGKIVHPIYDLQARQAAGEFDHTPARRSVFKRGDSARVLAGPFRGQVGEMLKADERGRVELMLTGLFPGRMWVDDDHLEAA